MENHPLTILPVMEDPTRPQYRDVHENLLKPPFRLAIVGASKSGKSNLLVNYLRSEFYGGSARQNIEPCFNRIIVMSPNLGMDSTTKVLNDICEDTDLHTRYSDGIIEAIIEHQKSTQSENRDRILIIADDLIALGAQPQALIFSSATYLRHLDCSIMYLTQTYKGHYSLPPLVRNNLDGLVLFKCPSHQQINSFTEDAQGTLGSKDSIARMLDYTTRKPYHFGFFNYRDLNVWHCHLEKIWQKFDENGNYSDDFTVPTSS